MFVLIWRQFRLDPVRTALTTLSIASVIAVILIFEGFMEGVAEQSREAVLNRNADLIVAQAGVRNLTLARSVLPQFARTEVEAIPGVREAHPLTGIPVIYSQSGVRAPLLLFVYDIDGGPSLLVDGQSISAPREIVVDLSFARKFDLTIGDSLVLSDFEFKVAGVTRGSAAFFSAFGFVRYDDLIDFYFESDLAADISTFPLLSFLLVDVADDAALAAVADAIEASVDSADVFFPEEMADQDEALSRTLLGPIIRLLVVAGYISGAFVVAIIMFAAANNRRQSLGVLKALGFSQRYLVGAMIVEALVLTMVALPAGWLFAHLIATAIESLLPLYRIPVDMPLPLIRTMAASLGFGVIGALMPIGMIRRLDPADVFRS